MKNRLINFLSIFSVLYLQSSPCFANVIFPHLMIINFFSLIYFGLIIITIETFIYKLFHKNISFGFLLLSTIFVNFISSFLGIFYGALSNYKLGYTSNFFLLFINFAICFTLSFLIEGLILKLIFNMIKKPDEKLFKSVFFANTASYIILFIIYCTMFYNKSLHKIFFPDF